VGVYAAGSLCQTPILLKIAHQSSTQCRTRTHPYASFTPTSRQMSRGLRAHSLRTPKAYCWKLRQTDIGRCDILSPKFFVDRRLISVLLSHIYSNESIPREPVYSSRFTRSFSLRLQSATLPRLLVADVFQDEFSAMIPRALPRFLGLQIAFTIYRLRWSRQRARARSELLLRFGRGCSHKSFTKSSMASPAL
jgi:hypothetical protein